MHLCEKCFNLVFSPKSVRNSGLVRKVSELRVFFMVISFDRFGSTLVMESGCGEDGFVPNPPSVGGRRCSGFTFWLITF